MKTKILITLTFTYLFLAGCSILPLKEVNQTLNSEQEQTPAGSDVFVSAIDPEQFDNLKLADFPSTLSAGHAQSAVAYKDHVFVAAINHILEYDKNGELVRYSDPRTFNCSEDSLSAIAIAGDTLYAACCNFGIYEIDLLKNRAVYLFDFNSGLSNVQNLYPVVDENNLWVATVNGLFKIDRTSRVVKTYSKIFGPACPDDNVRVFVFNNDVWTTSFAGCGSAEYHPTDDSWAVYKPDAFNQNDLSRVDFDNFIVSSTGIFAAHQDGGPDHTVLSRFDSATNSWERLVEETSEKFPEAAASFLPALEIYVNTYKTTSENLTVWHLKTADGWITLSIPESRYLVMTAKMGDRYFLLSSLGIEQFVKGQAFPELLTTQIASNTGARLLVSSEGNFLLAMSDDISDYSGEWFSSTLTVYNRQTKKAFTSTILGEADKEIPLVGFLKDPSAFSFVEQGSTLSVTEDGKTVLTIDPEKEEISFSE